MTAEELIASAKVIRSNRRTFGMQIKDGELVIRAPYFASNREIERFIRNNYSWIEKQALKKEKLEQEMEGIEPLSKEELSALMKSAKKEIPPRAAYYAEKIGVTYGRISIRCQKTRWGSCSAKGDLNFNCLLMLAPQEALDSVIVHELCHRKEMNHSKRFYSEVLRVFPEYRKWNKWLKENGKVLMARAGKNNI